MTYGVLCEKISDGSLPPDYYYAHVPALGLTTHGPGIDGARAAARELIEVWLAEKRAHGEPVPAPADFYFSTVDVPEDALQGT